MPNQENENIAVKYLKDISMFDPNKDFKNPEAKKHLSTLFNQLIMMDDPKAQEFFARFKSGIDNIIKDMGVVSSTASDTSTPDEVDMSPTPDTADTVEDNPEGEGGELPEDLLAASYNPLIASANRFLYI